MSDLIELPEVNNKAIGTLCYAKKFKDAKLDIFVCDDAEIDLMQDKLGDDVDESRYVALFVTIDSRESYYVAEGEIVFYDKQDKCIAQTSSHVVGKRCCDLLELNIPMSKKESLCQL